MTLARPLIASVMLLGLSTSAIAGDLQDSIARAAQQARPTSTKIDNSYLIPGAALFAAGMSMVIYGFLHTNGGEFVTGSVIKESNTALGGAGLGVAAVGGAILFWGAKHARSAPSVTIGPRQVSVSKRIGW